MGGGKGRELGPSIAAAKRMKWNDGKMGKEQNGGGDGSMLSGKVGDWLFGWGLGSGVGMKFGGLDGMGWRQWRELWCGDGTRDAKKDTQK
jgi:hypothetical protein